MRPTPSGAVFRALADPTRRDILKLLRSGPHTSGEIAARYASSWPTISRHLAVLRGAGLVETERVGQEIHYELNTSVFQDLVQHLMEWLEPAAATRGSGARSSARRRKKPRTARRRLGADDVVLDS
jgi:ArsR family transcriptional regulator